MPPLMQICVVVLTLSFVATVAMIILAVIRLGETAARLTAAAELSMAQAERVAHETQKLLALVRELVSPAQRVVKRFERLGERTADLSTAVLDEIEEPILTAVAIARGVRSGTSRLLDLLTRRFTPTFSSNNGDQDHE
jgi:uncharacterized protein YoxC